MLFDDGRALLSTRASCFQESRPQNLSLFRPCRCILNKLAHPEPPCVVECPRIGRRAPDDDGCGSDRGTAQYEPSGESLDLGPVVWFLCRGPRRQGVRGDPSLARHDAGAGTVVKQELDSAAHATRSLLPNGCRGARQGRPPVVVHRVNLQARVQEEGHHAVPLPAGGGVMQQRFPVGVSQLDTVRLGRGALQWASLQLRAVSHIGSGMERNFSRLIRQLRQ